MNIPKEITIEVIDQMLPVWEELAENGWDGYYPYEGLCEHFCYLVEQLYKDGVFTFLKDNFAEYFSHSFIKPYHGKEGAAKRVEVLQKIREELI